MNSDTYNATLALLERFPALEGWELRVVEQINANPKATGVCYPTARVILLRTDADFSIGCHEIAERANRNDKRNPRWLPTTQSCWWCLRILHSWVLFYATGPA